jgi:hypothetical protein
MRSPPDLQREGGPDTTPNPQEVPAPPSTTVILPERGDGS